MNRKEERADRQDDRDRRMNESRVDPQRGTDEHRRPVPGARGGPSTAVGVKGNSRMSRAHSICYLVTILVLAAFAFDANAEDWAEGHLRVKATGDNCYLINLETLIEVQTSSGPMTMKSYSQASACVPADEILNWSGGSSVSHRRADGTEKELRIDSLADVLDGVVAGEIVVSGAFLDLFGDLYRNSTYQQVCGKIRAGNYVEASEAASIAFPEPGSRFTHTPRGRP